MDTSKEQRIIATFVPQAWINDYAVEVDPEGETEADVTDHILGFATTEEELANLKDDSYETDDLIYAPGVPDWWADWGGPFRIEVEGSIQEYCTKIFG
jgi:hypothetical protein